MGVFTYSQGSIHMKMQLLMIKLVVWLGWLSAIALAQAELRETPVNLSDVGIACFANLAFFFTSLMRGRLYLEMGARDVMAIITGPKLEDINGFGFTTTHGGNKKCRHASVVMLSNDTSNSSLRQFMKYIFTAHDVYSIVLNCCPLASDSFSQVTGQIRECNCESTLENAEMAHVCNCVVFETVEEITIMLAGRMPKILRQLSDSLCLLPSMQCQKKNCHGCKQGVLLVEGTGKEQRLTLTENDSNEPTYAVCEALDFKSTTAIQEEPICICIPVRQPSNDDWTKMMVRSFKSKDKEDRGAIVMASDALENYLEEGRRDRVEEVFYKTASSIVPRLAEVLINLILTCWFRLDGFSSSLAARRAIRNYVVDSKGNGFAANTFITSALVKYNASNNSVCQVLRFRSGTLLTLKTFALVVGCVNLVCSIIWAVLVALDGSGHKRYEILSMPPSIPRVAVIIAAICISLGMDCLDLFSEKISGRKRFMLWAVIVVETVCIVSCSIVAGALGIKAFGRWLYSCLQGLVWVKWGTGSYLLGEYSPEYVHRPARRSRLDASPETLAYSSAKWIDHGILVYSSAFLLNVVLIGVGLKWK